MTIFKTNLNAQKPQKPEELKETVTPLPLKKDGEDGVTYSLPGAYSISRAPRRLLKICVAAAALTMLMIAICGGIYLYRMRTQKYQGWCGVKYIDDEIYPESSAKRGYLREHVDVDGNYEKIQVPKFSENNPAVILHDFGLNFTAIVDEDNSRCFVMPLDRKNITPPKGIVDLMTKMLSGYYLPDARVVRHRFKVIQPPVSDINRLGSFIAGYCHLYDTYMLRKIIMEHKGFTVCMADCLKRELKDVIVIAQECRFNKECWMKKGGIEAMKCFMKCAVPEVIHHDLPGHDKCYLHHDMKYLHKYYIHT